MIVFDTLDNLESYLGISERLMHVITVMDRSLPYDQEPGTYKCPESDDVSYIIEAYPTTAMGKTEIPKEKEFSLEIVLEGESITSADDNVFVMAPGRFLLLKGEENVKRKMTRNIERSVKSVIFWF